MICLLDDGEGMEPKEALNIVQFGNSSKKSLI
jgi:hypothetical protein